MAARGTAAAMTSSAAPAWSRLRRSGFTLIELLIGIMMLTVAITALLGAFLGQSVLNEHARNLTWAMNDASRVMEQLRQQNTSGACGTPTTVPPAACGGACMSWDDWLESAAGGGKSLQPNGNSIEQIFVTCQDSVTLVPCGRVDQVGAGEWSSQANNTNYDPLRVAVAVCWQHRNRTIGECAWNAGPQTLTANDADGSGVIDSPATLSTFITCRR